MPVLEAPQVELGSAPRTPSIIASPSPRSEISSASSPEPQNVRATPLFRMLAMPPPDPEQPPGQDELERRLPGYRRIVIPRELTLIELLKESSGVTTDEEVLTIREAKLRVIAERVGLRRLHVLAPRLRSLTLDGSAISSLRDLGIGLVHLKNLSVNRCGLTSLDGIWGLGALRELHAAANRLHELHPLAAMQKLHTLNLADNPIEESSRLWTIGVCSSLRQLTLRGTPMSDTFNYRSLVASALPMLVTLDDIPLNPEEDDEIPEEILSEGSAHDSAESDTEGDKHKSLPDDITAVQVSKPGSSNVSQTPGNNSKEEVISKRKRLSHLRPATTECAGIRPNRPELPRRPKTALERTIDAPTRLQIMNTLMDEEWRFSGSKLTSHDPVCGNLARALRRSPKEKLRSSMELEIVENTMEEACRALAAEIPRAPDAEQWAKFKEDTGNPFSDPWAMKLKLVPPACLFDPKYGVHKYIKANNIKLHYVDSGDQSKPLMVFLHGFPEFWYSWRHQIVHFNKDYRCIAVDMRGYGDSERPEGVSFYKMELLVDDIRDLIRQLGYEKCILISHDWGGVVACRLRDTYPEVLHALVMLASTSHEAWSELIWTNDEQRKKSGYVFMFRAPKIAELSLQMNNLAIFDQSMLVKGKESITDQDIECFKYWFGKQMAFTSPVDYYRANFSYTFSKKIHKENVPFLAVHGANDPYLSHSLLDIMKEAYTHIETVVVDGAGHFMQQEEPVKVNKVIMDMLAKHNL
ncbi:uncharacterized protein [Maniola hyperantus]|uniref:uncharacterized protein n=1 Tax=Aphantopus hyperantus TaxID=2795564 RepID=UPI0037497E50